ncbi:uncharacterized protein BDZ99DRAFT_448471 [Mytilinidion resinicola]|uniref:Mg2+ transporter protein n=1 Tax=Mytilinidion resinicola TaxID=574789 RepID=A0A6A6YDI4_9PEZI|nr:uncharacterized protein BDZ99DRAFT_448471 [Mytilinidion resinicola]KAF2806876.1 hypothetical protein BDZ99DRAFT_448471 [Mytilinidion resinicola]
MIEDIQPSHIEYLGERLSIDPVFFAGYLGTDYRAVEQHPLPLWATSLPSESATQEFCHLHYQRVVKLERSLKTPPETTLLVSATNVPRAVKRLTPLSGVDVALARTCTSFDRLVACITRENTLSMEKPSMISLCLNPLRLALREFLVYSITMNRYVRYYEYSLKDVDLSVREGDLNDLQIWRRRAFQTLQRLFAMHDFVEHWNTKERPPEESEASLGAWLIKDIQHLITAIEHHSRSLETMIPVTTAMVQLADVRRSTEEASHVKQLTYLALVFIPLSFVASLFSMSEKVAPWSRNFWLYFVVAVPLLLFVLAASWLMPFRGHTARHKQKMR